MSSENKNINILENFISKPNSLEAERVGRSYFLDNHSDVIPNEGNLMSLLTLQKFYKGNADIKKSLQTIGENESKYLVEAMKILTDDKQPVFKKIQQKFGNNFNASLGLAQMLKNKSEQVEFDKLINPIVANLEAHTKKNMFIK